MPDLLEEAKRLSDPLYEALFWISEYPNRRYGDAQDDAVALAEYARAAIIAHEQEALAAQQRETPT